ncbi:hypothetical protein P3S68_021427 [Capsicum galapagoense]
MFCCQSRFVFLANRNFGGFLKRTKEDFSMLILKSKKSPNQLVVDEAVNYDNFIVALNPATTEKLQQLLNL